MWLPLALGAFSGAAGLLVYQRLRGAARLPPRGLPAPMRPVIASAALSAGNVALIIGSASGIGRAAALRCSARGMRVALADIDGEDARTVQAECLQAGAKEALVFQTDCSKDDEMARLQREVYAKLGRVHLLMNNAATQTNNKCGPFEFPERWRKILEVNLWGVYLGGLHFIPHMIAQVNAFLLVPGCVNTMIRTRGDKWVQGDSFDPEKAQDERSYDGVASREYSAQRWKARGTGEERRMLCVGAWSADELVDELFRVLEAGSPFYIICQVKMALL
ncbi:MAG: hypothetical protein SGPRY_005677 [Prymnesium sp.]